MTLTEFLLARIAEDEARAKDARSLQDYMPYGAWDLDRVMAECEAKRRLVTSLDVAYEFGALLVDELLEIISMPYADHPDYNEAWRP